jgi:quercetin dioxygenase-like cupin family protein
MHAFPSMPMTIGYGVSLGVGVSVLWSRTAERSRRWVRTLMARLSSKAAPSSFKAVAVNDLNWSGNVSDRDRVRYFMKPLLNDAASGHVVMLVRYPAGEMNPSHKHQVGHGLYVLDGTLVTNRGSFGPNTFVWFAPHESMAHGAGPEKDMVAVFITNPDMRIVYDQVACPQPSAPTRSDSQTHDGS